MLANVAADFEADRFRRPQMDLGGQRKLGNLASIAFGGEDLSTVYLGTLFGERIAHFRSPIRGAEPVHWNF